MRNILVFVFLVLVSTEYVNGQKRTVRKDIIYQFEQTPKKNKIKIGFISSKDSTTYFVSVNVLKDGLFNYVQIEGENYYLNSDAPVALANDICNKLKKIEADTTVRFGEPLTKSISVVILTNKKGEVITFGIARKSNDSYYDYQTLQLLKTYYNTKSEPIKLNGQQVAYLLKLSFNFSEGKCLILEW